MSVTLVTTGSGGVNYSGSETTVYLEKRETSGSGGEGQTVDTWSGPTAAAREAYTLFRANRLADNVRLTQTGAASKIVVTWKSEFSGSGSTPQDDGVPDEAGDKWACNPIEIPTSLAAHPYFQAAYVTEAGSIIEDEIALADAALSRGQAYVATGDYKQWVRRYYGLRMAGVEEWPQLGVEVTRSFSTDILQDVVAIIPTVFQVVQPAAIGMPIGLTAIIAQLLKIEDYDSSDPNSYNLVQNSLEWLHRAPSINVSQQVNGNDQYDVTDTYWGVWKWSSVLYPGGTWDPQGEVA